MRFIFTLIGAVFCIALHAAVYYIDNTGGNDSNAGTSSAAPWQSLSKVNSFSFSPGDQILFKRGEVWRGALAPSSSGSSAQYITFSAYGSGSNPVITAATALNGPWTDQGSNRWSMSLPTQTRTMIFNGAERGRDAGSDADIDALYEFYWTGGLVYIYATGDPNTSFTSVEAGQGTYCVSSNNQAYLIFEHISVYGGQGTTQTTSVGGGFFVSPASHHITIQHNEAYLCQGAGIRVHGADDVTIHGNQIKDIDSHDVQTSGDGIAVTWDPATLDIPLNLVISGNTINQFIDRQGIAVINGDGVTIEGNLVYAGRSGIDIEPNDGSGNKVLNVLISNNVIDKYHNEISATGPEEGTNGIAASGEISYNIQILNNEINMQNHPDGLGISLSDWGTLLSSYPGGGTFGLIEGNVIKNARWGIRVSDHFATQKIRVNANYIEISVEDASLDSRAIYLKNTSKSICTNNILVGPYSYTVHARNDALGEVYHNVFYNYDYRGLYVRDNANLTVKNNLFYSTQHDFHFLKQGTTSTLSLNRNIYYPSGNYYRWQSTTYSLANLQSNTGQEMNGSEADPLFENGSGTFSMPSDFKLLPTSPAIDAAEDVNIADYVGSTRYDVPSVTNTGIAGAYALTYADRGAFEYLAVFPVSWIDFSARAESETVRLNWSAEIDAEQGSFLVEKSLDGIFWNIIAEQKAHLNIGDRSYHFTDYEVKNGTRYYYRIVFEDETGRQWYAPSRTVELLDANHSMIVYPNPVYEVLAMATAHTNVFEVVISDVHGKIMHQQSGCTGQIEVPVSAWAVGTYWVRTIENGRVRIFQFVKI